MGYEEERSLLSSQAVLLHGVEIGAQTGKLEKSIEILEREVSGLRNRVSFLERSMLCLVSSVLLYAVANNWITMKEAFFSLVLRFLR